MRKRFLVSCSIVIKQFTSRCPERIRIAFRCNAACIAIVALRASRERASERANAHGDGICSGIPVGNSRRLRDYSRHPLREYIIARRVYVSSYDRHFRFRRALLTSFRFWTRKCVYVHTRTPIRITTSSVIAPRVMRNVDGACHRRISRNILRYRIFVSIRSSAMMGNFATRQTFRRAKFNWKTK